MKKILFCWPEISGYMASCWKTLNIQSDINAYILAIKPSITSNNNFNIELMKDIPSKLLDKKELGNYNVVKQIVSSFNPDIIIISGWNIKNYKQIVFDCDFLNIPLVLAFDNPLKGGIKQQLGKYILKSFINRISCAFVTGNRAREYAKFLGFTENKIYTGLYGINNDFYNDIYKARSNIQEWPKSFIYIGQYIKRKGIDILMNAYQQYRKQVKNPWILNCCGMGPYNNILEDIDGVVNHGFIQPDDMDDIIIKAGVSICPSRYDSWGVVIAECCAAGLPIICTESCGASSELVRNYKNGILIKPKDTLSLIEALLWMTENYNILPEFGKKSFELASPYSSKNWLQQIRMIINALT